METEATTTTRQHLHRDDYPQTLRLLEDLRNGRPAEDWSLIGYELTDVGAWVDWDQLTGSWLSSTEKDVVHLARGAAGLERAGGPAPRMVPTVTSVIANVCGIARGNEWMDGGILQTLDVRRLEELDPDMARALAELDEEIADVALQLGAVDVTDADRAAHVRKMRRQLATIVAEFTGTLDELLE